MTEDPNILKLKGGVLQLAAITLTLNQAVYALRHGHPDDADKYLSELLDRQQELLESLRNVS